jgi:DHA1 family inner membrane transport protein
MTSRPIGGTFGHEAIPRGKVLADAARPRRRALILLLGFVSAAYVASTLALAPLLVQLAAELGVTIGAAGIASAAYSVPGIVLAVVLGPFSDRYGRKRFLVVGTLVLGLGSLAASVAPTFASLVASRVVAGIGGGFIASSLIATVADRFAVHERGRAMASLFSVNAVLTIVGVPAAGIVAAATTWRLPLVLLGVFALLVSLAVTLWLPSSRSSARDASVRRLYALVLGHRPALLYLTVGFLAALPTTAIWGTYLVAFFQTVFGLPQSVASVLAVSSGIGLIIGSQAGGRLADRAGHRSVLSAALLLGSVVVLAMTSLPLALPAAVGLSTVVAMTGGARMVTHASLLTEQLPAARGTLLSMISALYAASAAIGVTVGGALIDMAGFGVLGVFCSLVLIGAALVHASIRPAPAP